MKLSDKQLEVAQRTGQDICVVAGPGSGKTRVLVERFRWLAEAQKVSPLRILAITFTEKAATEVKERLGEAFGAASELRGQVERAYVSTVHGFCARLLRENPVAAGLDPDFTVMDEPQSTAELEESFHGALDQLFEEDPSRMRSLLEALYVSTQSGGRQPDLAQSLINVFQAARVAGKPVTELRCSEQRSALETLNSVEVSVRALLADAPSPTSESQRRRLDQLRDWLEKASRVAGAQSYVKHFQLLEEFSCDLRGLRKGNPIYDRLKEVRDERIPELKEILAGEYYAPLHAVLVEALEWGATIYRRRKQELGALDFSDLEEHAVDLLRRDPAVHASVLQSFDHILMDELQDTNRLQWALLDLVRRPDRFFGVGDINQSIYGFRHADPEVFREYRGQVQAGGKQVDELFENHRSREDILAAVNLVVRGVRGVEPHRLLAVRPFAEKQDPSVEVIVAFGDSSEEAGGIEAQWVARRVAELVGTLIVQEKDKLRGAQFRDVAVLARTMAALPPIEKAFQETHIPYLTTGGRSFYEAREIRDLVHLLRVVANPKDEVAFAGVLRSPLVGVSDETLLRLKRCGGLAAAVARLDTAAQLMNVHPDEQDRLRRFWDQLGRMRSDRDDYSPDRLLIRAIDASGYEEGLKPRARANVDKFLTLLSNWHQRQSRSMASLVKDLEWLRDCQSESEAPPDDSSDVVRLMTIHQAKGLQFPIVFLPALHKGPDRRRPPVCLSPEGGLGVRWRNPASGEGVSEAAHSRYVEIVEQKEEAEENRLLYVAMTRAEEHLVLSFAKAKRFTSNWWNLVTTNFGIDVETVENQPVRHCPDPSLPVRLLRVDRPPERLFAPAAGPAGEKEAILFLPRPKVTDQHDSAASVTSVLTFDTCPRRYYLGHYLGWARDLSAAVREQEEEISDRREEFGESDAAEFGREVHALLAGRSRESACPDALELVSRFESSDLGRRVARAQRVEREFDFLMALEDVVLRGQIDLWFEEGGELVLVDYKTDAVPESAAGEHARSYALQLQLYALALERLMGRIPDKALVCLLRPGCAIPIELDPDSLAAARESVKALREAQSGLQFELREGEHCFRCGFFHGLCLAGRRRVTNAGDPPSSSPAPP